ncbi:MAG: hypothetical protein ACXV2C_00810 [Candidatus Bathyarchaeia archaeon]
MPNPIDNLPESSLFELFTGSSSGTSNSSTNVDPYALDTMSSASGGSSFSVSSFSSNVVSLAAPENADLSLIQYAKICNSATHALQAQINSSDTLQTGLNIEYWKENAAWAQSIMDLRNSLLSIANKEVKLHKQQVTDSTTYNETAISDYNNYLNTVSATTNQMYLTQQNSINGTITDAQYNTAVDTWNANVGGINAGIQAAYNTYVAATNAYNTKVDANNAQVTQINAQRQAAGITDLLPLQPYATIQPIQLLPTNLPYVPPPLTMPTVPSAMTLIPEISTSSGISTTIAVSPTTPTEQAFLDSISHSLDLIFQGPISTYNSYYISLQDEMNTMKQAIIDYQNGITTDTQYNTAVSSYNIFATTANAQLLIYYNDYVAAINNYNNNLGAINDQINAFNDVRQSLGQELIPLQQPLVAPSSLTAKIPSGIPSGPPPPTTNPFLTTTSSVILPQVPDGSTTPTKTSKYMQLYFTPIFEQSLAGLMTYTKMLTLQDSYRSFLLFTLSGKSNLLPNNAFIDRFPQVYFAQDSESPTISGVGLTSMIVGLSNRSLTSIVTQTLLAADYTTQGVTIPDDVQDKTLLFGLSSLSKTALESALPTLALIKDQLNADNLSSNAVKVALASANLNVILNFIHSGAIEQAITGFLEKGLPLDQATAIVAALKDALSAGLLQFGIIQLARVARLPGLLPQILANFPDKRLRELLLSDSAKNFQTFINNPISVLSLKDTLATQLIKGEGVATNLAQTQINNAINNAFKARSESVISDLNETDDLRFLILRNLLREGVQDDVAIRLAQQAVEIIKSDLAAQDLDTAYVKQAFLQKDSVIQQILKTTNAQEAYNRALLAADTEKFETKRQFQNAFISQLEQQGVDQTSARILADQIIATVRSNEIRNSFNTDRINNAILFSSLVSIASGSSISGASQSTLEEAISAAQALKPSNEIDFRAALNAELTRRGIAQADANLLSGRAAIAIQGQEPLTSPVLGDFLDRNALAEQLVADLTKQFKGAFDLTLATELATRTALLLVGPTPKTEVSEEIRNPTSVLNSLIQAFADVKTNNEEKYADVVVEGTREFRKPTVELFDFLQRVLDPANAFLFTAGTGIMYAGMGRRPDNFKKELDIPI